MTMTTHSSDAWTELERFGQVPPAPDEALLAAQTAVRRAATTETLPAKVTRLRRRRRLRYALALGVAATVVAAGAVTVRLGGHQIGASPAAASVLKLAAHAARAEQDPEVRPGQYLKITTVEQMWGASYGQGRNILVGEDGKLATRQERRTRTFWIPYDVDADWTVREVTKVLRYGSVDFRVPAEPARTWQQPSIAENGSQAHVKTYDPDWYASLPHDPDALLKTIRSAVGGEGSGLAYDFQEIYSEVLRSGMAPAEVRGAVFDALADTPGMVVEDGVTALDGRAGVAIGASGSHFQMIFDAQTGQYLGDRSTDPDFPDVPGLDADKTTMLTSVTTTVADHAPDPR